MVRAASGWQRVKHGQELAKMVRAASGWQGVKHGQELAEMIARLAVGGAGEGRNI